MDCDPGYYALAAGQEFCDECEAGTYEPSYGSTGCVGCPAGKAEPTTGNTMCHTICWQAGEYSGGGFADCDWCPSGTYVEEESSYVIGNTACIDCASGKSTFGGDGQSSCLECDPGTYSSGGQAYCYDCDPDLNEYQNSFAQSYCDTCVDSYESVTTSCSICGAGTEKYAAKGQLMCTECDANFYNAIEGGECLACPAGKISGVGTASEDDCVSPAANFITATVIFVLCIPFAIEYVIHARFHRVAFLRTERVTNKIISQTREVVASLYHYAVRARAERKRNRTHRFWKTWFFLCWSLVVVFVITLLSFIAQMSGVLFASMILWKNLSASLADSFDAIMEATADAALALIEITPVYYFFVAMMVVFDAFANFTLDISAVDITCAGAQSPLELFINLVIMGLTIVVIESNIQVFRSVTFNSMTDKFIECFTQPAYRKWAFRDHGKSAASTYRGMFGYAVTGLLTMSIRAFGAVDVVQTFLQYIMSLVTISAFFPIHNFTDSCNDVLDYEGYDEGLATLGTVFAWLLLLPALYEAGKVLMPGLPPDMESVENVSSKRDPKSSLMHFMKYLSFLAPDLWMVVLGQQWTRKVMLETPIEYGSNSKELLAEVAGKRKSRIEEKGSDAPAEAVQSAPATATAVPVKGEKGAEESLADAEKEQGSEQDALVSKGTGEGEKSPSELEAGGVEAEAEAEAHVDGSSPSFRVVSAGTFAKTQHGSGPGFYEARAGYSVHVWSNVHIMLPNSKCVFVFCRLARDSGELLLQQTYDVEEDGQHTDGRGAAALAADMNASDDSHLVVLFSIGDPSTPKCLKDGLPDAVARCGGYLEHFGHPEHMEAHGAYALVGVPGCGEGRGFEALAGNKEHALIDVSFELTGRGFKMLDMHVEEVEDFLCLSADSYLLATLRQRSAEENRLWKDRQRLALPTMWTLCRLEFAELMGVFGGNPLCAAPVMFLVFNQAGHLLTAVGRRSWALICWKYFTFLQTCFGWWTEAAVSGYQVHEYIRSASVTWEKPIRRMTQQEYVQYRRDLAMKSGLNRLTAATAAAEERAQAQAKGAAAASEKVPTQEKQGPLTVVIDGKEYQLPEESDEQAQLQQEELKRALRTDYSTILHSLIACRSTLLILVPGLATLTILASTMASTPLFLEDERLRLNLPELFIAHPFEEARALEQEMVEEQEYARQTEMTEHDHDVDNPHEVFNSETGRWEAVPTEVRAEIEEVNKVSREEMREIITQLPRKVEEWRVLVQGITLMVTESRGINFAINLYKFVLTMAIALGGSENVYYWMITACIILIPYGVVVAMKVNLIIGRAMDVTDEDLHRAVGRCGCGSLLNALGIRDAVGGGQEVDTMSADASFSFGGVCFGGADAEAEAAQKLKAKVDAAELDQVNQVEEQEVELVEETEETEKEKEKEQELEEKD